jgi:hypothetical protein
MTISGRKRHDNTSAGGGMIISLPKSSSESFPSVCIQGGEEELDAISDNVAEEEHKGKEVSDVKNRLPLPRCPWRDPIKDARWIVLILWTRPREAIEMAGTIELVEEIPSPHA